MQGLPDLTSTLLFIGIVVFIGADFIAILVAYKQLTKRLKSIESERDELKKNVENNVEAVLEDARKQSLVVLQRAQVKAQQILSDTKQFQLDAKRIFETELKDVTASSSGELQKASQELLKNYEASLAAIKDQDLNLFKNISKTIEKDVTEEMQQFKATLENETISSQKIVEQKLEEQYATVGSEIQLYKKEQLAKVDAQIIELLHSVTLLTLGKALTLENQQELVIEALAEAKKQVG